MGKALFDRVRAISRVGRVRFWALAVLAVTIPLGIQATWPGRQLFLPFSGDLGAGVFLAIFLAALACEYVDSSLGMGYGTTLTPILLLAGFEPLQVVPCVLLSELATGFAATVMHQRDGNVDLLRDGQARQTALLLSALSVVGALAAVTLALRVPKAWLSTIIAVIILSVGVTILATLRRRLTYRRRNIIVIGAIAAFNKGLSGGGYGPLTTSGQVFSGVSPRQAVAITSLAEALTCFVGLGAYLLMHGRFDGRLAVPLVMGALFSVPVATLTVRCLPESWMRAGVGFFTCLLGLLMVGKLLL
ncbi:MAG: sulfite exporter TauE/SafE family protein [Desulfuromonas sp.]|uniref:sulfite exporter TauE/SafE family protein n=1 Tax=Desulfuromonas sp. TaxID=892 RepID=UPI000CA9FE2F|nr:sulfite exporter TauE/SafE family protein [Desulfuromonas sp.]PLX82329.1 MAG: sulfite exporter TauE/SafE family protein [Desulfuromonas sp.]